MAAVVKDDEADQGDDGEDDEDEVLETKGRWQKIAEQVRYILITLAFWHVLSMFWATCNTSRDPH